MGLVVSVRGISRRRLASVPPVTLSRPKPLSGSGKEGKEA